MSKRVTNTEKTELVETHNLYLAFQRLHQNANCDWRRAFMHALQMSDACNHYERLRKLREALELP